MAFETAFLALMPHTVTHTAFSAYSTDGYGTPSYGTASTSIRARVVARQRKVLDSQGAEIAGDHVAWLNTTRTIGLRDKLTFSATTYEILEVARFPDMDGLHHQRLTLRQGT